MRILILFLLCIPLGSVGQSLSADRSTILLPLAKAGVVDYWARKGIAAGPYIDTLSWELRLKDMDRALKEHVISNQKDAITEYRSMVERLATNNQALTVSLAKTQDNLERYKEKNRKKGQIIAVGAGVAIVFIVLTFVK